MKIKKILTFSTLLSLLSLTPVSAATEIVNTETGPNSVNNAEVVLENKSEVEIKNSATVNSCVDLDLETGQNEIEDNTTAGSITTGDANASVSFSNEVNKTNVSIDNSNVGGGIGGGGEEDNDDNDDDDNGGNGGGNDQGGIGGGDFGGIGGGSISLASGEEAGGIGGGTLPEAGSPWAIASLILALLGSLGAVYKFRRPFEIK